MIILSPIFTLIKMFLVAGVLHVVLLMFQAGGRGFGATLTVVAYSQGVFLVAAVPQCGGLIAMIWQLVILIVGLAAVHRTTTGKSAAAVLLPGVLCICCACIGIFSMAAAIGSAMQGGSSNL
jgi:hypothetical protein